MKKALFFLAAFAVNILITAQSLNWVNSFGGTEDDVAYGISIDKAGNIYTAGYFGGTVDFDPGAGVFNLTALGDENIFVQKLDANGNFIWAKGLLGTMKSRAYVLDLDSAGNLYFTGFFQGTVDFDPNAGTTNLTSNGNHDLYVMKLSSVGNLIWVKAMGGPDVEIALGITIDPMGNVISSGGFSGSVDFDPGAGTSILTSNGNTDIFVQKLDSLGDFVWAKAVGGSNGDYSLSVDVDALGNTYNTGYYRDTVDFDPNSGTSTFITKGSGDIYLQKLDAAGNLVWTVSAGSKDFDRAFTVVVDNAGDIYSTGHFQDTVDFDPGSGKTELIANGKNDIYIQKLDASGNLLWAKSVGSKNSEYGMCLAVDKYNSIYTSGYYRDTIDFDPGTDTLILIANNEDVYIQKLNAAGNFVWAVSMGGTGYDRGVDLEITNFGDIYCSGNFQDTADFDPGPDSTFLISSGQMDAFILKLKPDPVGAIHDFSANKILLYPNPNAGKFIIELPAKAINAQLNVFSLSGEEVHQRKLNDTKNNIDISDLPQGVYIINITLGSGEKYYGRVVLGE